MVLDLSSACGGYFLGNEIKVLFLGGGVDFGFWAGLGADSLHTTEIRSGDSRQETKTIRRPACQRTSAVFAFFEFDVERTTCTHARLLRRWVMRHTIMAQWQPMAMDGRTWPGLLGARGSLRLPMERRPSGCRQCSSFVLQSLRWNPRDVPRTDDQIFSVIVLCHVFNRIFFFSLLSTHLLHP